LLSVVCRTFCSSPRKRPSFVPILIKFCSSWSSAVGMVTVFEPSGKKQM
jgi:hypothetical protein